MLVGFSFPALDPISSPPTLAALTLTTRVSSRLLAQRGTKLKRLRYYNSAVHSAAFVLPEFARQAVAPFVVPGTGF